MAGDAVAAVVLFELESLRFALLAILRDELELVVELFELFVELLHFIVFKQTLALEHLV